MQDDKKISFLSPSFKNKTECAPNWVSRWGKNEHQEWIRLASTPQIREQRGRMKISSGGERTQWMKAITCAWYSEQSAHVA